MRWRTSPRHARMSKAALACALAFVCALASQPDSWAKSPTPKPTRNKQLERKIAAATDGVEAAGIKVQRARNSYKRHQSAANQSWKSYKRAVARSDAAHRTAVSVRAQYWQAVGHSRTSAAKLAKTTGTLRTTQSQYEQTVRNVYMGGGSMVQLAVVLDTIEPADLALRVQGLDALGQQHKARIDALSNAKEVRSQRLAAARANERQVAALSARLVAADRQAAAARASARAALQARKRATAAASAALRAARSSYNNAMAQLRRLKAAQRGVDTKSKTHSSGIRPGSLAWPVLGHTRISSYAGGRIHPVFGRAACHAGIDVPAASGTPIHAAAAGVVISASSVRGYGNMTLIAHGGGMATLYGHQSKILVRTGQKVKKNQVIGKVGSTGWSTGPHLHFEVRLAGMPYNPLGWFGRSRTPVSCYRR